MRCLTALLLGLVLLVPARAVVRAEGDLAAHTVVLVNASQPESVALGEFYLQQRGIPAANLIALNMPAEETIPWRRFVDEVWQPLQDELVRRGWIEGLVGTGLDAVGRRKVAFVRHNLAYLVVCRGTPLRISHDPLLAPEPQLRRIPGQFRTNQGALDSELSLLAAGNYEINGLLLNPLFNCQAPHAVDGDLIIKVSRLDGPTDADARHLVTSALTAEAQGLIGRAYVDLMPSGSPSPEGDRWLTATARTLEKLGFDGDVDRQQGTIPASARFDAPALYFGWYAGAANGPFTVKGFAFPPGAIALHIYSFSAQTLRGGNDWCPAFIAAGVAATVGNVFEPYLGLTHRPDLLLQALAEGETLGDAAYYALPALSWQAIVIGDPLYRPFLVPLAEQQRRMGHLPPALAPYVVLRESHQLEQAGRPGEARALRADVAPTFSDLPLALAAMEDDLAAGHPALVPILRATIPPAALIRPTTWPLVWQAARQLVRAGATGPAMEIYQRLAAAEGPDKAAELEMLGEAEKAARAAGDRVAEEEFKLRHQVLAPPAAVTPPTGK